jgi:hypothetical protein
LPVRLQFSSRQEGHRDPRGMTASKLNAPNDAKSSGKKQFTGHDASCGPSFRLIFRASLPARNVPVYKPEALP